MSELNRIGSELGELLESLSAEHSELEKIKDEMHQWHIEETAIKNNILELSKKIRTLQAELEDYLEK